MARKSFAPSHTLTGTPRFVPGSDSAWRDPEKVRLEWPDDHVYWRYQRGETRFNLEDPELLELLDMEAKPEIWELRPLPIKARQRIAFMQRRDMFEDANEYAYVRGPVSVENLDGENGAKLAKLFEPKKRDHEAIIEATGNYATNVIGEVGNAVIRLSADLTRQEKKASDSPPGSGSPSQET